ncbi:hypothetical protein [Flavihumibacter solisilvae]|jgi:hypothetical protein|nr:hypothetical protein [Flavihumibacter solisilvae]
MRSVSATKQLVNQLFLAVLLLCGMAANAQENSPYSRYGWGNLVPSTPIATRGMGGIGAGYVDFDPRYNFKNVYPRSQTVNFLNPASYSRLKITSFDLGFEVENQVLREQNNPEKYKASYVNFSYLQLGIPISRKHNFAMVMGLRPISRVNYKILSNRLEDNPGTGNPIDSSLTTYEGTGGSYQAYAGLGKAFGKFSIGANVGYFFGTKDFSTRKELVNDSIIYNKLNNQTKISFGGFFLNGGAQYAADLGNSLRLVLGATATLKHDYNASTDFIIQTFQYDGSGGIIGVDSVYAEENVKGKISFPASYSGGFTLEKQDKWMIGADYVTTSWDDFAIYGRGDTVASNWKVKFGAQLIPNAFGTNYWGRVTYRVGFNFGPDYIKYKNQELNQYNITAGFGFPVRPNRFSNQYTNLNLSLEYGRRGSASTQLQENVFRLALGFTLSDLWFVKRRYD